MTKLEDLIANLCPNGVEYKSLGECATVVRGASPRPINRYLTEDENGVNWIKIGDVEVGAKYVTHTAEKIIPKGAAKSRFVRKGDFILSNSMSFGRPYVLGIDGCIHDGWLSISNFSKVYLTDFLYYLLNSEPCQAEMRKKASFGGAVRNLNADIVKALQIPVPPLPVQEEIVRILDKFTALSQELSQKLSQELSLRKKQYEYYRDDLLNDNCAYPLVRLGDFSSIFRGGNFQKKDFVDSGKPCIHYGQIYTYFGAYTYDVKKYLTDETFLKSKKAATNDVVMAITSENLEDVCLCTAWLGKEEIAVSGHTAIIRHNQNAKYLSYYFHSKHFFEQKKRIAYGTKVIEVSPVRLQDVLIPLPSIEEQNKIADVLDRFDKLTTDLSSGLPAEISARRKQYEYYRDLLLTFPVKAN